jgi:hypothetical protein
MGHEASLNESNIASQLGASLSVDGAGPGLPVDGCSRLLNVAGDLSTPSGTDLAMNPSRYGPLADAAGGSDGGSR